MSSSACPRCGLESRCSHGTWGDRHPVVVAVIGVAAVLVVATSPWLLLFVALGAVAHVVDREYRRRRALAARCDWEYHQSMTTPPSRPPTVVRVEYDRGTRSAVVRPSRPRNPAAWHLITQLPTEPIRR